MKALDFVYHINDLIGRDGTWNIVLVGLGTTGQFVSRDGKLYSEGTEVFPDEIGEIDAHEEEYSVRYERISSL